jgi:dUTP pyrophosphatase
MRVPLKQLDPGLPVPRRSHPGDGGVDLYARHAARLEPGTRDAIPTGIAVAIPEGHAGLVVPRSGLALRHGLSVVNSPGLVDSGYRGEVCVILVNLGEEAVEIARGDRIAQFVVVPVGSVVFAIVEELPDSERGEGGFGSTGGGPGAENGS